jgi:vancomycin resistance protein YoaR
MEARIAQLRARRKKRARYRMLRRTALAAVAALGVVVVVGAFVYAGSSAHLADGVSIAGVNVGGLSSADAQALLERRQAAVSAAPLEVTADGHTYRVRAAGLGIDVNWQGAVAEAQDRVGGFRPIRGFRRLAARAFGIDVTPVAVAHPAALQRLLDRLARDDAPHRDAAMRFAGVRPVIVEARPGRVLDRKAAEAIILGAFATLDRAPVTVPMHTDQPRVSGDMLGRAVERARLAVSAPVTLRLGSTRYRLSPRRIATLLELPANGRRAVRVGGSKADAYFADLSTKVNRKPTDAQFVPVSGRVLVKPSLAGRAIDVPRTARRLLAAALSPTRRTAAIVVGTTQPGRTTADAKAMGVTGTVSSYTTIYGGDPNRIHNVQLVARLIDNTLIAPGHVFSFNGTTGDRNEAKGFLSAPVIVNGELQTGLGGGVCQVSTTVFNTAYEAGLNITDRTNHALYISHYPQGRDATVNYPDTDLKFVNDTGHWLLLRTFVGSSSLTVNLYGTPQHRRVESVVAPLRTVGSPPVTWKKDPTITKGRRVVAEAGSPSLATSVHRTVYDAQGKLLYDNVWYSSYRGEKKIVLVGTKPKPEPAKPPKTPDEPAAPGDGPGV